MEILKKIFKQPVWTLGFCMVVVLVFSLFANVAHTSLYNVKVEKINFDTETNNGNIEGLLYTPKGCDAENPCPVIVLTHGYLNSKEMQDAPAIEMSKRGYIVLAFDMYDHGGSTWETPGAFSFFMKSMWDAVQYVYEQDYTLKDANGNGMIGVSGHSMGAYSTELAVMYDTMAMASQGHRKIAVSLTVGADYRYSSASIIGLYGSRSSGMIIGHYDEFFGDPTDGNKNTVKYKNYIETDQGKEFLGNGTNLAEGEEYEAGKIYDYAGGQRVIYTPNETHPWNHFSTETTSYMIDFYAEAFEYQLTASGLADTFETTTKGGQTWWLKEAFECVALIALMGAVIPALSLLLKVPFFAKVKTEEEKDVVEENTEETLKTQEVASVKGKKVGLVLVALFTSIIPAWFFPQFIYKTGLTPFVSLAEYVIRICILAAVAGWLIYAAVRMVKGDENEEKARNVATGITKGAVVIGAAALLLRFVATEVVNSLSTGYFFNAPTANSIAYWAIISAAISVLVLTIVHYAAKKREGSTIASYGLKASFVQVAMALLISVILFVGLYLVVFLIEWIFNTDFRLWVYAVKSFKWHHFVTFLKYVPIYFIYYFVNSIVVAANTKDVKGWKGYVYALALNIGGLVLFIGLQYGKLFLTGTAAVPNLALEGILLFGLVPSLAIAAIFAKKFAEKTNNIWTSAFFNTFLFTMIAIANTAIYLLSL